MSVRLDVSVRHEDFRRADEAIAQLRFALWIAGWAALGHAIRA